LLAQGALVGGHYRVVRALGRGGMGEVYEAVQEPLSRRVALKTMLPDVGKEGPQLARFRREAEAAAALGHPNIIQVTDFQCRPGEPALIVMEILEGMTLRDVVIYEGKLEPGRAAFIALQVLSGLAAAHKAGIIHRDVKPANVFLTSTLAVRDLVKILDFGVAKLVDELHGTAHEKITAFGQVLGTMAYMAPEQASAGTVDRRADIYSVGATLFNALTGFSPMDAITPGAPRRTLSMMAPWLDQRLCAVVDRALERAPDARFQSAEEMAEALAPFVETSTPGRASYRPPAGIDPVAAARLSAPTSSGTAAMPSVPRVSTTFGRAPAPKTPSWLVPLVVLALVAVAGVAVALSFWVRAHR
jgi:serine/threonine-protein kinase